MEITVSLDGDLVAYLRKQAGLRGASFDEVVNDALRHYVSQAIAETPRRPYRVRTFSSEYAADLDLDDPKAIKDLLADLDNEHFLNVQRYGAGDPDWADS